MGRPIRIHLAALAAALILAVGTSRPVCAQGSLQAYPEAGGAVLLTWLASPDPAVVGYNVYRRQSTLTADKATLANPQPTTGTSLTDAGADGKGLPLGISVTYFVKAVYKDAAGKMTEGARSGEAIVTPQNALSLAGKNFFAYDIDTLNPHTMTMSGNVLTLMASGPPLWDRWDGQTFIAAPVSGDYQITAEITENPANVDATGADNSSNGSNNAKAGIEIRTTLAPLDLYEALFTSVNRDPAIHFEGRTTVVGGAVPFGDQSATAQADTKYPLWLRLVKKGSVITAFQSFDGKAFDPVGGSSHDFGSLPTVTYAGLFVSADHQPDSDKYYTTGKFDTTQIKIDPQ
jgi:hypothetical protein